MKCSFTFCCFIFLCNVLQAQYYNKVNRPDYSKSILKDSVWTMSNVITEEETKEIITFLASDQCKGRELGSVGNDTAAAYIASKFAQYGIQRIGEDNSYYQNLGFRWVSWDKLSFNVNNSEFKVLWDYVAVPTENKDINIQVDEVVFCGYGIEDANYSDYKNVNVKDKVILIYHGEPTRTDGTSWITNSQFQSDWSTNFRKKVDAAKSHGVKMILVIEDKFKDLVDAKRSQMISPVFLLDTEEITDNTQPNICYLSSSMSSHLIGKSLNKVIHNRNKIKKKGKPLSFAFQSKVKIEQVKHVKAVDGKNIMAYFEGTEKKDEVLIISAHYDHIGMRNEDVFNGADDNGSGTTAVIQVAKALQMAKQKGIKMKRSVLCLLVTGEEKGLLGSNYYVNNPRLDLNKTIGNINIDMIGRVDAKYLTDSSYLYVIGSDRLSSELHEINESVNQKYSQLILDYTYNAENDPNRYYYRSDHYNFAEKRIPAIFFFNGTHEDYHRITDDIEKINIPLLAKRAKHVFYLAWELVNRDERIKVDR